MGESVGDAIGELVTAVVSDDIGEPIGSTICTDSVGLSVGGNDPSSGLVGEKETGCLVAKDVGTCVGFCVRGGPVGENTEASDG